MSTQVLKTPGGTIITDDQITLEYLASIIDDIQNGKAAQWGKSNNGFPWIAPTIRDMLLSGI